MITVREARLEDAARLCEIYDYYVRETAISFEYETPDVEEFGRRMQAVMRRYPYLVAEREGLVIGYIYAHPFVGRAAYDWCVETTIYLDKNARHTGAGRLLYEALERALRQMGVLDMYACVGTVEVEDEYLTNNSADFHRHIGFRQVGEFRKCGRKFDRWYDMVWLAKNIGEHSNEQAEIKSYIYNR